MTWKTAKAAKRCTTFPTVWAAILGCTGSGNAWRYTIGHFGRRTIEYACPTCRAAQDESDAQRGAGCHAQYQAHLRAAQDRAGVADYRLAEVVERDGRPVLTGKVDVHKASEAAYDALHGYCGGDDPVHAVKALRVLVEAGGD